VTRQARHGHDPRYAYVAAGAGFLFLADTTQEARERFGPVYEQMVAFFNQPGERLATEVIPVSVSSRNKAVPSEH
jgi:alkanesulfonate monooxygenase SsuD/methylene tetrahydromethanopterin reductase-like flavin-dependent oxidoreductase (luciferase family)